MLAQIEEIKPIEVRGQTFFITVLRVSFKDIEKRLEKPSKRLKILQDYFTAYVYLKHLTVNMETFGEQTYRKGNVIGIDTSHYYNTEMSSEEKKEDAYRQIINVIEEYLDVLSDLRKVVRLKNG